MSLVRDALHEHAVRSPERMALSDQSESLGYRDLHARVSRLSEQWRVFDLGAIGLLADNGVPWVVADLAALVAGIPLVPLPLFFSPGQMLHAIADSGVDVLLTDRPAQIQAMLTGAGIEADVVMTCDGLTLFRMSSVGKSSRRLPLSTAKVTYTSGTTGEPKGVCLSRQHMEAVAGSLMLATGANCNDRHLCLTPLSTLLENIGGIYVPLLAGASCHVLPLARVGLSGSSGLDAVRMVQALDETAASSAIMVPQMLHAMLRVIEGGMPRPSSLRFIAVGGAPVSAQLLDRACELGIPAYEGYGLSECASVVSLNSPGNAKVGSLGRPLPHLHVSVSSDGEIMVSGGTFLGYLGHEPVVEPWPTGDLGYVDEDGFLHLRGRKKSMFVTSFGKNIAPEWIESELTCSAAIAQAAVFGEACPFNVAVITPAQSADTAAVANAIAEANARLPDYARVHRWTTSSQPFAIANQQITANGRLRRDSIRSAYLATIESLFQEDANVVF